MALDRRITIRIDNTFGGQNIANRWATRIESSENAELATDLGGFQFLRINRPIEFIVRYTATIDQTAVTGISIVDERGRVYHVVEKAAVGERRRFIRLRCEEVV